VFLGLCCGGCGAAAKQPAGGDYPPVLPVWIVEDDPNMTIYERKDLERDRKVGKMLVIPLYRYFQHDGATEFRAIAHPFVYQQGEDIEKQLSSFDQRENLRRLIFWVPGYFPDGMGRTFRWVPVINGKRTIVLELQPCLGSEKSQINSAMKSLLVGGDFAIGKTVFLKAPPPPYAPAKISEDSYDASQLVRSTVYGGRYYNHESTRNEHSLWAFNTGTQIVNRLSAEEKKTVAAFAEQVAEKEAQRAQGDEKKSRTDGTPKTK